MTRSQIDELHCAKDLPLQTCSVFRTYSITDKGWLLMNVFNCGSLRLAMMTLSPGRSGPPSTCFSFISEGFSQWMYRSSSNSVALFISGPGVAWSYAFAPFCKSFGSILRPPGFVFRSEALGLRGGDRSPAPARMFCAPSGSSATYERSHWPSSSNDYLNPLVTTKSTTKK